MKGVAKLKKLNWLMKKLWLFSKNVKISSASFSSCYLGKWNKPDGNDTGIKIYNSVANRKVPLILKSNTAKWYACGPTVYDESHLGHASCYIKIDIIRRVLENVFKINVKLLLGITDIDDKIIKKSIQMGIESSELAKMYEDDFFNDMSALGVIKPSVVCHVTDYIPSIISFCEKLILKKYAYATNQGNVYFKVSKAISSDLPSEEESQSLIDPLKNDKRDFALWKASKPGEPFWSSPWGNGRPGWHIECSAMASEVFGSELDIHSGGYDLLFPHHSNEKSQSEAYHECPQWGNYWIHSGLLQVGDDVKMSKSLKNTISIKDFLKENSANDFRIICLQSSFRKNIYYSCETLTGAKSLHKKFHGFLNDIDWYLSNNLHLPQEDNDSLLSKLNSIEEKVVAFLAVDFNTPSVISCLTSYVDEVNTLLNDPKKLILGSNESSNSALAASLDFVNRTFEMLGVQIITKKKLLKDFILFMNAVIEFRNQVRLLAIRIGQKDFNQPCLEYIENAHKSFQNTLNQNQGNGLRSFVWEESEIAAIMLSAVNEMNTGCSKLLAVPFKEDEKSRKEIRKNIFILCDNLRSSAADNGITLKDYKETSSWFPDFTFSMR